MDGLTELLGCGFFFILGWLVGVERKNALVKELTFWQAYARERDLEWEKYVENQEKFKEE